MVAGDGEGDVWVVCPVGVGGEFVPGVRGEGASDVWRGGVGGGGGGDGGGGCGCGEVGVEGG